MAEKRGLAKYYDERQIRVHYRGYRYGFWLLFSSVLFYHVTQGIWSDLNISRLILDIIMFACLAFFYLYLIIKGVDLPVLPKEKPQQRLIVGILWVMFGSFILIYDLHQFSWSDSLDSQYGVGLIWIGGLFFVVIGMALIIRYIWDKSGNTKEK